LLNITEEQKEILKYADKPITVFKILEENIMYLINMGLNKKTVLNMINEELGKNIPLQTFYTFIRRKHTDKVNKRVQPAPDDTKSDKRILNPFFDGLI